MWPQYSKHDHSNKYSPALQPEVGKYTALASARKPPFDTAAAAAAAPRARLGAAELDESGSDCEIEIASLGVVGRQRGHGTEQQQQVRPPLP